jgi:hypothetical protein
MLGIVAAATLGAILLTSAIPSALYAPGDYPKECDSSNVPPFKDFPGASGPTGNPHTCEQPTGDPHDDPDNPSTGNPHNTD